MAWLPLAIVNVTDNVPVPAALVAANVGVKVPAAVGVPLIIAPDKVVPAGSAPDDKL
jgi:hypothetical protein